MMLRTTTFWLALTGALLPVPAFASEEDTQFWADANVRLSPAENWLGNLELSQRWRETDDVFMVRGTVEYAASDIVRIGGGAAYLEYAGGHEFRPHQQISLSAGWLNLRARLEQQFRAGVDDPVVRLRARAEIAAPLAPALRATGSVEKFAVLGDPAEAPQSDQTRFVAQLRHKISPRLELTGGYRLIWQERPDAPDRLSHIPHVAIQLAL